MILLPTRDNKSLALRQALEIFSALFSDILIDTRPWDFPYTPDPKAFEFPGTQQLVSRVFSDVQNVAKLFDRYQIFRQIVHPLFLPYSILMECCCF